MTDREKPTFVQMFLKGKSVADCATFFLIREATAEQVLREAITQLSHLNQTLHKALIDARSTAPKVDDMAEVYAALEGKDARG